MFKNKEDVTDPRSILANNTSKIILDKYSNVARSIKMGKEMLEHFHETIENFYELIDDEIPFMKLCELMKDQKNKGKNFGLTPKEYELEVKEVTEFCLKFYDITEVKEQVNGD